MKIPLVAVAVGLAWCVADTGAAHADDALRHVQQSLHDQGFYYGTIDGTPGDETTQAIRRYQIRSGLGVTGQLNDETRRSIEGAGVEIADSTGSAPSASSSRPRVVPVPSNNPRPVVAAPTPAPAYRPPTASMRSRTGPVGDANEDDDRAPNPRASGSNRPDLRADGVGRPEGRPYAPGPGPLPRGGFAPSEALSDIFASTPYEFAPPPVQADVLRRAQAALQRDGYYEGRVNGVPGPVTASALSNFQRINRLRRTGRLDVATLGVLRLLPGRQTVDPRGDGRGGPGIIFQGRVVE